MSGGLPEAAKSSSSISSLLWTCAALSLAIFLVAPAFVWYGHAQSQVNGVLAAAIAGGICWLGGTLALVAAYWANRQGLGIHGALLGMFFRMGLPLIGGLALQKLFPVLAEAKLFSYVLGFYLIMLVVETLLSLRLIAPQKPVKASQA